MLKMIGKRDLGEMEVSLPSLEIQARIAELFSLFLEEERLTRRILDGKKSYMEAVLSRLAAGGGDKLTEEMPHG